MNNLLKIYSTLENKSFKETEAIFENSSLLQFKEELAKSVIKNICPIGEKVYRKFESNVIDFLK